MILFLLNSLLVLLLKSYHLEDYDRRYGQGQIHWFAILNSLLILVFLFGCPAVWVWSLARKRLESVRTTGEIRCFGVTGVCLLNRLVLKRNTAGAPKAPTRELHTGHVRSGMVAMILLRTLHRDIATYNQVLGCELFAGLFLSYSCRCHSIEQSCI